MPTWLRRRASRSLRAATSAFRRLLGAPVGPLALLLASLMVAGAVVGRPTTRAATEGERATPALTKAAFIAAANKQCRATARRLGREALRYGRTPKSHADVVKEWRLSRAEHAALAELAGRVEAMGSDGVRLGRYLRLHENVVRLVERARRARDLDISAAEVHARYQVAAVVAVALGISPCGSERPPG